MTLHYEPSTLPNCRPAKLEELLPTHPLVLRNLLETLRAIAAVASMPLALQTPVCTNSGFFEAGECVIEVYGPLWLERASEWIPTTLTNTFPNRPTYSPYQIPFTPQALRALLQIKKDAGCHIHNFLYFRKDGEMAVYEFTHPPPFLVQEFATTEFAAPFRTWMDQQRSSLFSALETTPNLSN